MPSREDVGALRKGIIGELNRLSHLIGRFQEMVHRPAQPKAARPEQLDPLSSLYWAAALAQTLSDNTCRFRDSVKAAEPIPEDKCWPEPDPIDDPKVDDDSLWTTIRMTISMELATFKTMTDQYPSFDKFQWKRKRLGTISDLLNEIILNTNDFIAAENGGFLSQNPVQIKPTPAPTQIPVGSPERPAIISLEHGLRRYIEVHMQIATFIPAHLRNAPTHKFRRLD